MADDTLPPAHDPEDALRDLAGRVREIHDRVVAATSTEAHALIEILGSTRRLAWVNFVAGLARGLGLFLGVSLVGGVLLGIGAFVFDKAFATLGLKDITLQRTVTTAYAKYVEIQGLIGEAQRNIDRAKTEMQDLPAPTEEPTPGS